MKTYHNAADTGGITKIAMKIFWTFWDKEDRLPKLQKSDIQRYFSMAKNVQTFLKKTFHIRISMQDTNFCKKHFQF